MKRFAKQVKIRHVFWFEHYHDFKGSYLLITCYLWKVLYQSSDLQVRKAGMSLTCTRDQESWGSHSRRQRSWGPARGGWGVWEAALMWLGQWQFCKPPGCSQLPPFCCCQWQTLLDTCGSPPSWNRKKPKWSLHFVFPWLHFLFRN